MTSLVTCNIKHSRTAASDLNFGFKEFRVDFESVVLLKGCLTMGISERELVGMRVDDPTIVRMMRARLVHSMLFEIKAVLEDEIDRKRVFSLDRGNYHVD